MTNCLSNFEQISIFDIGKTPLKIDKPVRLIELFAGIGSQAKALERLGVDFEHYRVCEFDKYAIKSYNAIHGTDFVTSDITQITASDLGVVDTDKYCYIMTYSFPCQDLSLAGLQKGMAKGGNTRSGLLWEVERLLNECEHLPQILLMENVTQVHGKKNLEPFRDWLEFLESKGYSNYWQDLNAKNYGIPQNRNRTFMVSVLGDYTYEFPKPIPLEIRLKDMLEHNVDERYYLSDKAIQYISKRVGRFTQICDEKTEVAKSAITSVGNANWTGNFVAEEPAVWDGYNQRIRAEKGTVGTLTQNCGADLKRNGYGIIESSIEKTKKRIAEVESGKFPKDSAYGTFLFQSSRFEDKPLEECSQTVKASKVDCGVITDLRIRKLTPKECWRLMGFDDVDFNKAAQHNSNVHLYRQAGNSIVVDLLVAIFRNMF